MHKFIAVLFLTTAWSAAVGLIIVAALLWDKLT